MDWSLFASKFLPLLVYPLNVSVLCLLVALGCTLSGRRGAAVFSVLALAVLLASANAKLATSLFAALERQYPVLSIAETPQAEAILVLGGGLALPLAPRKGPELVDASDRLWHAARLYRAGRAPLVIISGGNVFPQSTVDKESVYARDLLVQWGVPRQAVLIEKTSRNTYENAIHSKALLDGHRIGRVLLVTSAFHMPRALAVFRSAGVDALPVPTDIRIVDYEQPAALAWVPNAGALATTTAALHEYLGIGFYRLRNWIRGSRAPVPDPTR